MKTTAVDSRATTSAETRSEPVQLRERTPNSQDFVLRESRIGSTTYEVSVHFSKTSKETLEDKILRLIESEVQDRA